MLDKLTTLVSTILALSFAVERIIEILKGMINRWLFNEQTNSDQERLRCALIHLLAAAIGCLIAGWATLPLSARGMSTILSTIRAM